MKGIIVGADRKIEWLLDFWWSHYSKHNCLPVTFVDFGMSEKAKEWCSRRGAVLPLQMSVSVVPKSKIKPLVAKQWEEIYGKGVWKMRQSWFKKPFALLQTPYEHTLWLDLDCEVLAPLDTLLDSCNGIALAKETESAHAHEKERGQLLAGEILYNSGVILYRKGAPLIQQWVDSVTTLNAEFLSDQQLLSRLIFLNKIEVYELGSEFNWRMSQGVNIQAVIIHWVGEWGKAYLRKYNGISNYLFK